MPQRLNQPKTSTEEGTHIPKMPTEASLGGGTVEEIDIAIAPEFCFK